MKTKDIEKDNDIENRKVNWYIVVWRNKNIRSRKVGTIFGTKNRIRERQRIDINKKTRDFEIAEKFALICVKTGKEFGEWMNNEKT